MINLPLIAILTSAILFLFGLYFSYKKGLKLMVYYSIISIFGVIASYLIFIPIYKPVAKLFSEQIFDRFGDSTYDWSYMLEVAKAPIYTIGVSILFVPVTAIIALATYFVYKRVDKASFDKKISNVDSNKNIVKTRNTMVKRAGGLGLGVITTTFIVSIPTSALTTFFINHESYAGPIKFLNGLINVVSFGKLGTPVSYIYLTEATHLTKDSEFTNSLSRLISPSGSDPLTANDITTLNDDKYKDTLDNLFKDEDATSAFLSTIGSKISSEQWKPIGDLYIQGYNPTTSSIDSAMTGISWTLSRSQVENIFNWILEERIERFENTPYWIEWDEAVGIRMNAENALSNKRSEFSIRK